MGRTSVEEFIGQKTNELLDRWDVYGGMEKWDGGVPGVVTDYGETAKLADDDSFRLMCCSKRERHMKV